MVLERGDRAFGKHAFTLRSHLRLPVHALLGRQGTGGKGLPERVRPRLPSGQSHPHAKVAQFGVTYSAPPQVKSPQRKTAFLVRRRCVSDWTRPCLGGSLRLGHSGYDPGPGGLTTLLRSLATLRRGRREPCARSREAGLGRCCVSSRRRALWDGGAGRGPRSREPPRSCLRRGRPAQSRLAHRTCDVACSSGPGPRRGGWTWGAAVISRGGGRARGL